MKIRVQILMLCWLLSPVLATADLENDFRSANAAYLKGNYEAAIEIYEKIAATSERDAALYYNLGTAYLKLNRTGKAVLNLERAAALVPNDRAIRHNLQAARAKIVEPIEAIPPFFLRKWLLGVSGFFTSVTWAILGIVVLWAAAVLQLIFWFKNAVLPSFFKGWLTLILGGSGVLFLLIAATKFQFENPDNQAIVMNTQVSLRSAPEPAAEIVLELFEGTKVQVLDVLHDWQKVELSNGDTGWIAASSVERI